MGRALRRCPACTRKLRRRPGERPSRFATRKSCREACRIKALRAIVARLDAVKHEIPCGKCGKALRRSSRVKRATCASCVKEIKAANSDTYRHRVQDEARRYRVLMTALGWDDFGELLEYLRGVPWTDVSGVRRRELKLVREVRDVG